MPVTTFDIPKNLLAFIDELVDSRVIRNRREIVIRALENSVKFQMQKWNGPLIFIHGVRQAVISSGCMKELIDGISEKGLYEAGRRMGMTLRDSALISHRLDVTLPENHKAAVKLLEDLGWGIFKINDNQIIITDTFLPSALIHGYLETALSLDLKRVDTTEDIRVFEKVKGQTKETMKNSHSTLLEATHPA